jgi:predicted aspartyl protease
VSAAVSFSTACGGTALTSDATVPAHHIGANYAGAASKQFVGIIDTGFTGVLQMPLEAAAALGLVPIGTVDQEYADGRIVPVPLAEALVTLGPEVRQVLVHLQEDADEVLVGLGLLREFRKALIFSPHENRVLLPDSTRDLR